jgi:hypothetical protein
MRSHDRQACHLVPGGALMPNVELDPERELSTFRRLALGTWRTAYDPSVYGSLTLRMDGALAYIDAFRAATGRHLTVTHLMARAVAAVLEQVPEVNAVLRAVRIYRRRRIGVFFQVALKHAATGKLDLSGATIHDPQHKSLIEICDELEARFAEVRADHGGALARTRRLFARLPLRAITASSTAATPRRWLASCVRGSRIRSRTSIRSRTAARATTRRRCSNAGGLAAALHGRLEQLAADRHAHPVPSAASVVQSVRDRTAGAVGAAPCVLPRGVSLRSTPSHGSRAGPRDARRCRRRGGRASRGRPR